MEQTNTTPADIVRPAIASLTYAAANRQQELALLASVVASLGGAPFAGASVPPGGYHPDDVWMLLGELTRAISNVAMGIEPLSTLCSPPVIHPHPGVTICAVGAGGSGGKIGGVGTAVQKYATDIHGSGFPAPGWSPGTQWCFTGGPGPDHPSQRDPYQPASAAGCEVSSITPSVAANKFTKG